MKSRKLLETREKVLEILRELKDKLNCKVYLFGSYALNTHTLHSDVDIVVISERFEGLTLTERVELVRKFLPGDISFDIIPLTPKELELKLRNNTFFKQISRYWIEI